MPKLYTLNDIKEILIKNNPNYKDFYKVIDYVDSKIMTLDKYGLCKIKIESKDYRYQPKISFPGSSEYLKNIEKIKKYYK